MNKFLITLCLLFAVVASGEAQIKEHAAMKENNNVFTGTDLFAQGAQMGSFTFATLPASPNGTLVYCADCVIINPCAGAGTGSIARREGGGWDCGGGGGGGGSVFQSNGTPLSTFTTVNFQNSAPTTGLTLGFTNPSAGNVQLTLSGILTVPGGGSGVATLSGVVKGNGSSAFSSASAADIVSLFSGCSGTLYLGADGACHVSASPLTTNGDEYIFAGGINTRLPIGSAGQFEFVSGGLPAWDANVTDNGTIFSVADSGGIQAPVVASNGSGAGILTLTQGFDNSGICPANSVCVEAPLSISSSWTEVRAGAGPGATSVKQYTVLAGGKTTESFVTAPTITGDGALFNNVASSGAVTLTLANAGPHLFWGNTTGVSGIPGYVQIGLDDLAAQAADTVVINASGGSAPPIAGALPSCSGGANALDYNTSTHVFGCNTITGVVGTGPAGADVTYIAANSVGAVANAFHTSAFASLALSLSACPGPPVPCYVIVDPISSTSDVAFPTTIGPQPGTVVGMVNVAGSTVTWVAGHLFNVGWTGTITIGGSPFTISSVSSTTSMTLTSAPTAEAPTSYSFADGSGAQEVTVENRGTAIRCTDTRGGRDCLDIGQFGHLISAGKGSIAVSSGSSVISSSSANVTSLVTNLIHDGTQSDFTLTGHNVAPSLNAIVTRATLWLVAVEGKGTVRDDSVEAPAVWKAGPLTTGSSGYGVSIEDGDTGGSANMNAMTFDNLAIIGGGRHGSILLHIMSGALANASGSNYIFNGLSLEDPDLSNGVGGSAGNCILTFGCMVLIDGSEAWNGSAYVPLSNNHIITGVVMNNPYFETFAGSQSTASYIELRNTRDIEINGAVFSGGPGIDKCLYIAPRSNVGGIQFGDQGAVILNGRVVASRCVNTVFNAVSNTTRTSATSSNINYIYPGRGTNDSFVVDGDITIGGHLNQTATGIIGGSCTMTAGFTCTFSLSKAFNSAPITIASPDASDTLSGTANPVKCSISGTTVTITTGILNSATWDCLLIGNPN